jgi:hypothetical protein
MSDVACALCSRPLDPQASYVVRIDVFADPSGPTVSAEELADTDPGDTIDALIEQMKGMTADELQDQVHRRFEYRLCPTCQRRFLANPLGRPRNERIAEN